MNVNGIFITSSFVILLTNFIACPVICTSIAGLNSVIADTVFLTIDAEIIAITIALHHVQNRFFEDSKYYISSANFNVAIPYTPDLMDTFWITSKLIDSEMNIPDAITVAQVLRDVGSF